MLARPSAFDHLRSRLERASEKEEKPRRELTCDRSKKQCNRPTNMAGDGY